MVLSGNELVALGARFSTQRLLEQGAVSVAMARAHAAELGAKFPPARVDELEGLLGQIRARFDAQGGAKTAFRTGNAPVNDVIDQAKCWIADIIAAADNAFEEDHNLCDEFHKGGKIRRSVPKITGRLQALSTLAA
jgi:hypothetical protein